jgi:hypothetical protein
MIMLKVIIDLFCKSTTMKINFCNTEKKAILKRTQLIHFLKKGRAPKSWIYGLESNWIKML